ncbi:MAG: PilN domain-containing protein [Nitrospira sp.]|nr:PilN domain-containing protein [bacterium]MBL7049009.1 PilN domain-containing protein [Nitrospira sp.]
MIRINLLPNARKRNVKIPATFKYGALLTVIILIGLAMYGLHLGNKVKDLKATIAVRQAKLNELKTALQEVKDYERRNQEFRDKTQVIERLKRKQIVPLRLLDEVSNMLPNGVWLTDLSDRGGMISLTGFAFSNPDLVSYVQNLKESKYLIDVMLIESRQEQIGTYSLYKFKLTFRIKV